MLPLALAVEPVWDLINRRGKCQALTTQKTKRCGTRTRREPGASNLERLTTASRALKLVCAFVITASN